MDREFILFLMNAMKEHGMMKVVLKEEGYELQLERESTICCSELRHAVHGDEERLPSQKEEQGPVLEPQEEEIELEEVHYIVSPMVGTFYASPAPDAAPFVSVGDQVDEDTVVCVIEAMKVMNEIKAGKAGIIQEVLIESGQPVEFGTNIFSVL